MNVLDENIPLDQRDLLTAWRIPSRVIGQDIAAKSVGDDDIVRLLHRLKQPTLFSRDEHFFKRSLCHFAYGLVWLDMAPEESAMYIRRVLTHPDFNSRGKRLGAVIRAHHDGLQFWRRDQTKLSKASWSAS